MPKDYEENKRQCFKLAFVVPYFGKLPNYFQYWLETCKANPTIDWLIFTDDQTQYDYPSNVKVEYLTFDTLRNLFQANFDFKIELTTPYKLTDFKPSYGEVFHDYLISYDFWGFCDIDLIFGDIRSFITDDVLSNNDKVLANGHCVLLRNTAEVNQLYRNKLNNSYPYKTAYSNSKHFGFDEYGDTAFHTLCQEGGIDIYINNTIFADINSWKKHFCLTYVRKLALKSELTVLKREEMDDNYCNLFLFDGNKLIRTFINGGKVESKEYLYVHFQKRSLQVEQNFKGGSFLIVPNKFISPPPKLNKEVIKNLGRKQFISGRRWKRRVYITSRLFVKKWFGI